MPRRALPQSGEASHLSFPTGFPSGGAVVTDLDEVALVGHLGVHQGAQRSQAGHYSWGLMEFLMVLSDWMVRPPWSFGRARVFHKWAAFVDSPFNELIAQDPLPSPRDLGRGS